MLIWDGSGGKSMLDNVDDVDDCEMTRDDLRESPKKLLLNKQLTYLFFKFLTIDRMEEEIFLFPASTR